MGRRRPGGAQKRYPRTARVNEVLREVVADEIERLSEGDDRLRLITVTAVETAADLGHATVYLSSLGDEARDALLQHRVRLQAGIGRQVRLKRTPQLTFAADPVVASAERIEEVMRKMHGRPPTGDG